MFPALKVVLWNANGLCQHAQEIELFLQLEKIDILLVSETHLTFNSKFNIRNYNLYHTNHPDGRAHGGTAILIKSNIKHNEFPKYSFDYLQGTVLEILTDTGKLIISALYCPPRHNNKKEHFDNFFKTLGNKFLVGGDFNAKHTIWGSRLSNPKGRALLSTLQDNKLEFISTGEPTYWPSDPNKTPDLIDFFVSKGIDKKRFEIESSTYLSSDHSPIILKMHDTAQNTQKPATLSSRKTNWSIFRDLLNNSINLKIPLQNEEELETASYQLTQSIQQAAWAATPDSPKHFVDSSNAYSIEITDLIKCKRRLRKQWQTNRNRAIKSELNRLTKRLKFEILEQKNKSVQFYLSNLSPTQTTDYDLWKATKKLKQPQVVNPPIKQPNGLWTKNNKEKADTFACHLSHVFKPWEIPTTPAHSGEIDDYLKSPYQLDLPIANFKMREIKRIIKTEINPKKSPGFDLITGKILQELSPKCLKLLTIIFNAVIRLRYFPSQWKISQIIMILKPGKEPEKASSYRPISLLPVLSKLFEKLLYSRMILIIEQSEIIPNHQFGFRNNHSTIEQVHRIVNTINHSFETKKYCSAVFLDISQAFDKVWHSGLLYKLKKMLPYHFYEVIKSYLHHRHFYVNQNGEFSDIFEIKAGVPQGSVLGPILYLLYTSDLPNNSHTMVATFADDTAILASHENPTIASNLVQHNLNQIQNWLEKWKIRANETKSVQVTFTLRRETCPPVQLNNALIPQATDVKYLGVHLDRRLNWQKHIFTKRKQLGLKYRNMYWLIGRNSELTIENKLLLYHAILKPIWTYCIQLWGSAAKSNIAIIQRFQNKILRSILDAPWYVTNEIIQNDLQVPTVEDEISRFSQNYRGRLASHPNSLTHSLMNNTEPRRLQRNIPANL